MGANRTQKAWSKEEDERLVKLYESGKDIGEISVAMNRSWYSVRNRRDILVGRGVIKSRNASHGKLNPFGVKGSSKYAKIEPDVVTLWNAGYGSMDIGRYLNVNVTAVNHVIRRRRMAGDETLRIGQPEHRNKPLTIEEFAMARGILPVDHDKLQEVEEVVEESREDTDMTMAEYAETVAKEEEKKEVPVINKRWTDEEKEQLANLYNAGYSQGQIAETLGRTPMAVMNAVQRYVTYSKDDVVSTRTKKYGKGHGWTPDPSRYYIIDGEKLKAAIRKKGIKLVAADRELSLAQGSISSWANGNYLPKHIMLLIDKVYDIKLEDILPDPDPVEVKEEETNEFKADISVMDLNALSKIIEEAVYRGCKRAFEEV